LSRRRAELALSGRRLRASRALALLEHLGTAEARTSLERVAKDAPEAWLTAEANDALKRLGRAQPLDPAPKPWEALIGPATGPAARAFLSLATAPADGRAAPEQIGAVTQLAGELPPLLLRSRGNTAQYLPHDLLPYRKAVLDAY